MAQNNFLEWLKKLGPMLQPGAAGGMQIDPEAKSPTKLQATLGNPIFRLGTGLLASGQDDRINPVLAGMQGLLGAQQFGDDQQRLLQDQALREQLETMLKTPGAGGPGGLPEGISLQNTQGQTVAPQALDPRGLGVMANSPSPEIKRTPEEWRALLGLGILR